MSREIKFRAWHKVDGWCGAFSIHQTGLIDYGSGWMTPEESDIVLMQYSGLKDKNGKEIYEGDIWGLATGVVFNATVEMVNASWSLRWANDIVGDLDAHVRTRSGSVIGNIYEHSHLLKNGQQ